MSGLQSQRFLALEVVWNGGRRRVLRTKPGAAGILEGLKRGLDTSAECNDA
ncbi:MAG: hypothetical protein GY708_21630 [Actinomycetia bacterium]|nr:hypothetical protein [Actinomycetes bacterium]MCP4961533.1 hypothetical protein [Actinomycetes bacterium]